MKRSDKEQFIADYSDKFSRAVVAVLADFRGVTVDEANRLRSELRKVPNGEYRVVKNSLCRRILADTDKAELAEHFNGPTAVYFGYEDPVAPTKVLTDFAKSNKKAFELKAAYFDGKVLTPAQIKVLSDMPSKEQLQSMLLGLLQQPATQMVSLLANVPRGLLNVLTAYKDKKEEAAA
jgi:large subunit ribosomal protein L10